jgi:hypothetical protein
MRGSLHVKSHASPSPPPLDTEKSEKKEKKEKKRKVDGSDSD